MTWQRLLRSPPSRCDVLTQDSRTSSRQASAPSASPLGHLMSQIGFPHSATSRHWLRLPLPSGRGGAGGTCSRGRGRAGTVCSRHRGGQTARPAVRPPYRHLTPQTQSRDPHLRSCPRARHSLDEAEMCLRTMRHKACSVIHPFRLALRGHSLILGRSFRWLIVLGERN